MIKLKSTPDSSRGAVGTYLITLSFVMRANESPDRWDSAALIHEARGQLQAGALEITCIELMSRADHLQSQADTPQSFAKQEEEESGRKLKKVRK